VQLFTHIYQLKLIPPTGELFCYYINLIVSTGGYNQKHLATLRKYNFFKDLVNSDLYKEILHNSIASSLKQMMSNDS